MSDWDDHADGWDTNPAVRLYAENAFESLKARLPLESMRILDFGCGTGTLTERLAVHAAEVVAIDSSMRMIAGLASKRIPGVTALAIDLTTDAEHPKCLTESFDLITASSVCAFLPSYEATLVVLRRLLAPNGYFVQWDWELGSNGDGAGFTKTAVERALITTGYGLIEICTPFSMSIDTGEAPVLMALARNTLRN